MLEMACVLFFLLLKNQTIHISTLMNFQKMTKVNAISSGKFVISYADYSWAIYSIIAFCFFQCCDTFFEYSPYQVKADDKLLNRSALIMLENKSKADFKPFRIALIGDSHTYYDEFKKQVDAINRIDSIDFVVHLGDITLSGIYREFQWYSEIIARLNKPLITVIGNHDCLANGETMYKQMFGDLNFTCTYNDCKLVFWDDIIWERNNKDPDFEFLQNALYDAERYTHKIVFAHIQPWDDQFSLGNRLLYNSIMENNGVSLSIHGHQHTFYCDKYFGKVPYLLTGDATDREIVVAEVLSDTIMVHRVQF